MPARLILVALLALVAFPSTAGAAISPFEQRLEQAREEAGNPTPPRSRFALPAGNLDVDPAETVGAQPGQRLIFTVSLDRAVSRGSLALELPDTWTGRAGSGLLWAKPAELVPGAAAGAALERAGDLHTLSFRDAQAGDAASLQIRDVGIPAGDYRIPWSWTGADGAVQKRGASLVRIHAPTREGDKTAQNPWTRMIQQGVEINATEQGDQCASATSVSCNLQGNREEQSETFIGVSPYDSDRILVQSNNINDFAEGAFLSTNGGKNFKRLKIPNMLDAPGEDAVETGSYCCDPMSAEDNLGNIWFGGLSRDNGAGAPSRIFVNRIAAGTEEFQPLTVGLPLLAGKDGKQPATEGLQDKNLMTIDNSPTSPTYGRLYVTWNDTGGSPSDNTTSGNAIVISHCDTRTAGLPDAARCDNADNWTVPVIVAPRGSLIYTDAAVGPDGRVYVTWWDFSARNAIRGRVCDPSKADCASSAGYGEIKDIAILNDDLTGLNENSGEPLPFACPIPAQPGGRPGPSPGVEVDISNGPNRGRVYVSWGDLRPGSGVRRCEQVFFPGTPPTPEVLTWDSFVASAPNGELPGDKKPSVDVATRLYTDADLQKPPEKDDKGNAAVGGNSDEWFPWLVVDQETGRAYGDFYSTRDSPSTDRRTTHFYTREIFPDASAPGGHRLGTLTRSSTRRSDYSTGTTACCVFGNDYGDYTGLDSAEGYVFPVWTRRAMAGDDGDAYTVVPPQPNPNLVLERAAVGEAEGADLDGQIEPGEPIRMFVTVKNPSEVGVTAVRGTLFSLSNKATVTQANSPYPDIAAGGGLGTNSTEFGARLASDIACRANGPTLVDFRVALDTAQGPESVSFLVPVCAPATLSPADRRGTPTTTTTPTPTATPGPKTTAPTACVSTAGFRSTSATRARRGVRFGFERRTSSAPVTVDVFRQSNGRRITGERLVARFTNVRAPFTWNGRSNRGKRVGDGYYFARYRIPTTGGRVDVRRETLRRRNGRFSGRPSFYRRESCGIVKSYKLSRPVFGGSRKVRALGITFRTTQTANVRVEVLRGSRVVRTYRVGTLRGAATRRLSFSARGRRPGDYRVRLTARPQKGTPITATLTSRRL